MKRIISFVAIALLIVQLGSCKKSEGDISTMGNDGSINFLTGDVRIVLNDNTVKANVGDKIIQGMTIITGAKSVVDIYFASSVIRVFENSNIVIQELVKNLDKEQTELFVQNGKMFSQITKKLTENEKFSVNTPTAVAAVRGTEFLVIQGKGKAQVSCIEGKVVVGNAGAKDLSFVEVDLGKTITIESGKSVAAESVENLSAEDIKNIRKIKSDIEAGKADITKRQKGQKIAKVEDDDDNVETIKKDATKLQAGAIKGDIKKDASGPGVKNFIDDIKSENRAIIEGLVF